MSVSALDESLDNIARVAVPRVLAATLNAVDWTSLTESFTPPPGTRRGYLTIGACEEAYELRFHADDVAGIRVPAGQVFHYPLPVVVSEALAPAARLLTGTTAAIAVLIATPDTA